MIFAFKRMELCLLLLSLWAAVLATIPTPDDGLTDYEVYEGDLVLHRIPCNKACPENGGTARGEDAFKIICRLIYSADANRNHGVTQYEFVERWMDLHYTSSKELARAHFYILDVTGDSTINRDDDVLLFNMVDFQKDGKVPKINYWLQHQKILAQAPFVALLERKLWHGLGRVTNEKFRNLFTGELKYVSSDISRRRFIKLMTSQMDRTNEEAAYNFEALDHNHDGWITSSEMDALFQDLDMDQSGDIGIKEVAMMARLLPKYLMFYAKEMERLKKFKLKRGRK